MYIAEFYFGFHAPATLRQVRKKDMAWTRLLGHVEAWGYTIDGTWFFLDPTRFHTTLEITHMHDEIELELSKRFTACQTVIRYSGEPQTLRFPLHGPMTCVRQCAALVGVRAFTPRAFRRKLLALNAEVIHERRTEGERGRSESPTPGTPPIPS